MSKALTSTRTLDRDRFVNINSLHTPFYIIRPSFKLGHYKAMSLDISLEKDHGIFSDKPSVAEVELMENVELRHQFSVWSLGSLCLCLMATWEALSTVVATALTNGGAPCLFYN
jgi:hypothetical protein